MRRTVRSYHGPELHLDALKKGNIARFVNDNMYRAGESESKGSTANLETQFIFLKEDENTPGTIHLAFYTTKHVKAGEELVSQYGESYCQFHAAAAMLAARACKSMASDRGARILTLIFFFFFFLVFCRERDQQAAAR